MCNRDPPLPASIIIPRVVWGLNSFVDVTDVTKVDNIRRTSSRDKIPAVILHCFWAAPRPVSSSLNAPNSTLTPTSSGTLAQITRSALHTTWVLDVKLMRGARKYTSKNGAVTFKTEVVLDKTSFPVLGDLAMGALY